jgi:hypothetical protein
VKGADKDFTTIKNAIHQTHFDGSEAVNLIIEKARTGMGNH